MIKDWLTKIFGTYLENKAGLYDGTPSEGKAWYKSKTIWAGIIVLLRALYEGASLLIVQSGGKPFPPIPPAADAIIGAILGGAAIQGRVNASQPIVIDEAKSPKDQS